MARDIVYKIQNFTNMHWNALSGSSSTIGCLMKTVKNGWYYKLSSYNHHYGIYGHESVCELIASRLLNILQIPHTRYKLIHAKILLSGEEHETWLCASKNYRKPNETPVSIKNYHELLANPRETPLDFCIRSGFSQEISNTMLADFLIRNEDRHGSNIEVLIDKNGQTRIAPMFDFGFSLLHRYNRDRTDVSTFDPSEDFPSNNYVGTPSLFKNLELMPQKIALPELNQTHREYVLHGLQGILSKEHLDKAWELIEWRYAYYETLYHST